MPVDYVDNCNMSRSNKNVRLYREVYGKYDDIDNLPLDDNTDEIDMERLRELVSSNDESNDDYYRSIREEFDVIDVKKRNFDKERMYDINKILEKAKSENNKLKEPVVRQQRNLLSTLQLKTLSLEQEEKLEENKNDNIYGEDNIYMTREFKFKELNDKISELNSNPLVDNVMSDNDLSLDLFEDLKPVGNTIITKPIKDSSSYKGDIYSKDTSDIDIIKPIVEEKDEMFFTSSHEFSKKDFNVDDQDDYYEKKSNVGNVIKIILLLLAILIFSFVIVYFVINYGVGV